jgi:hypothetical protein
MTLALATAGYLQDCEDWFPNLPPAAPIGGWANLDPNPVAPTGKAQMMHLPPAPPHGGGAVVEPSTNAPPRAPTGRAQPMDLAPSAPKGKARDTSPNPPPRAPSGGKAKP